MGERDLVIGYESALAFWRRARVGATSADGREPIGLTFGQGRSSSRELVARACALCGIEPPLDAVVSEPGCRRRGDGLRERMNAAPIPDDQVFRIDRDIAVCRMPVALVQLARDYDEVDLARVAYEMMGTYGLTPWTDEGSAQELRPLVDEAELRSYVRAACAVGVRGSRRARDALDLVVPGSNSPLETDVALFMSRTRARGGVSLGGFAMNHSVHLSEPLQRVAGRAVLRPDFYWPELGLMVELESDRFHLSPEAVKRDERRRRAFEAEGFVVRRLFSEVLRSNDLLNIFMSELASHVDPRRGPASDAMLAKRRDLRERLFGPELTEEALAELNMPYFGRIV